MQHLAVAAAAHAFHHQVLGDHEWELAPDVRGNDFFVHHEAGSDVVVNERDGVGGQEGLGDGDSAVRRVIERALEPLRRRGHSGVQRVDDEVPGQRVDALRAHRISLVRHRRRADLFLLERLLDLAQMLQQSKVVAEFRRRLREA